MAKAKGPKAKAAKPKAKKPAKSKDTISRTPVVKKGKLFVFSGTSGSGKTTIAEALLKQLPMFQRVVTCTTRAPREGEKDGMDYHFISREKFDDYVRRDMLLEHAEVYGNYYGSLKREAEAILASGKSVLLVIDVQGAMTIKKKFPEAILVFIKAPSLEVAKQRLLKRAKDAPSVVEERMLTAQLEMRFEPEFNYSVINDGLGVAIADARRIVSREAD